MPNRAACLLALCCILLIPAPAGAVTLRQYFADFTDRERGIYLTGLVDMLRADTLRETNFLACVEEQGVPRLHAFLTGQVRQDPQILRLEVGPWLFYAARTLCGEDASPPELAEGDAAPQEVAIETPASIAAPRGESTADGPGADRLLLGVLAAAAGALVAGGITALALRRRSRKSGC